jgi:hypothetical protein
MVAEATAVNDTATGSLLLNLALTYEDVQKTRIALSNRGMSWVSDLQSTEDAVARALNKELRKQAVWPWLAQFKGLGGVHVARLLAYMGNPHRFPGQMCTLGHHFAPMFPLDVQCPAEGLDGERCPGVALPPRTTTGVRSWWHYCGLHVANGKSPRKAKGVRCDWNPAARTAVLMPGGIAEQIVRQRTRYPSPYGDLYEKSKERIQRERGVAGWAEFEPIPGSALADVPGPRKAADAVGSVAPANVEGAEERDETDVPRGPLRPFQVDALARKIAAKAFIGDLLIESKRVWT